MARRYAINGLPGLNANVHTHVNGEYIKPGDEFPEGTETFDLTVFYKATRADVAAGAEPGQTISVALYNVPLSYSMDQIMRDVRTLRAHNREVQFFGYIASEMTVDEV